MDIQNKNHTIRGYQVMLDSDLAQLYGVKVKRLNEQVKRNSYRSPVDFCFKLTKYEKDELVAKCDLRTWAWQTQEISPLCFYRTRSCHALQCVKE